ncbi:MAG: threonine synthase [Deltaproteobacteria bacterium]|nr:threonine synthase [Deltaproteobacteria bacterium]MBW2071213.1 threonine synthase [Deltaproteobacteria bacterium]
MRFAEFPDDIKPYLLPKYKGDLIYRCLDCSCSFNIQELLYTCPECGSVLLLEDRQWHSLKEVPGQLWQRLFDYRRMLNIPALKGIFLYHELIAPVIPAEDVIYLGEGHTPLVQANNPLRQWLGMDFYFKNDGQNPSASFKDRGMACALSYLNHLIRTRGLSEVLAVCASTGDTSAAAALYSSYLSGLVKSAVLLPAGKVTPQQLSQPLGSGARVFEIPGVFDDCMKVVEYLAEHYQVALLNSKNAWRILGQESYSFEIAQDFDYDLAEKVVVVPIGNAGNITAVLGGFIKLFDLGIIDTLPKIIGVQSEHADPVYRYYLESDPDKRVFRPVTVRPSVAQAAMIGNPVSMPRVIRLVERYEELSKGAAVFVVQVSEQEIMDWQLTANRNGHIACTQGGECLAGLRRARAAGLVDSREIAVLDATAHALKFAEFQERYFAGSLDPAYEISSKRELQNTPQLVTAPGIQRFPRAGRPLEPGEFQRFVEATALEIARKLGLEEKSAG